jgi:hypothetical protein
MFQINGINKVSTMSFQHANYTMSCQKCSKRLHVEPRLFPSSRLWQFLATTYHIKHDPQQRPT